MQSHEQQLDTMGTPLNIKEPSGMRDVSSNNSSNIQVDHQPSYQSNSPSNAVPLRVATNADNAMFDVAGPIIGGTPLPMPHKKDDFVFDKGAVRVEDNPVAFTPAPLSASTPSGDNVNSPQTSKIPTTTSTAPSRRVSITDAVLASAATAASTAATAASTVVTVARRLVVHDEDDEDDNVGVEENPSLLGSSDDHYGLEFQQRKLASKIHMVPNSSTKGTGADGIHSEGPARVTTIKSADTPSTSSALNAADGTILATVPVAAAVMATSAAKSTAAPVQPTSTSTSTPLVATTLSNSQVAPDHATVPVTTGATTVNNEAADPKKRISSELDDSILTANTTVDNDDKQVINQNNKDEKDAATNTAYKPKSPMSLNTMYVTGHGVDSARHQAMGVDLPSVSHTTASATKRSGMGVDMPRVVGQPVDPKTQRKGGLHVDGKHDNENDSHPHHNHQNEIHVPHHDHDPTKEVWAPIQTSKDNSKVIHGNDHYRTQNTLPEAKAAISKNPFEAHMSHHPGSSSSGMNVDHPVIPTSKLAGSGSSDNTNRNRPVGVHNSAINVDKAGSGDHKQSGMGVDNPAIAAHHLAAAHDPLQNARHNKTDSMASAGIGAGVVGGVAMKSMDKGTGDDSSSKTPSTKHYPEDDRENLFDKVKGAFRRRSSAKSTDQRVHSSTNAASAATNRIDKGKGKAPDVVPIEDEEIPFGYEGPVPQLAPGEHVVWVKRTIKTDFYEDGEEAAQEVAQGVTVPAEGPYHDVSRRSSTNSGSFFDRLRRRHSTHADKSKQRT